MSKIKSKLPDMNELSTMATKLFKDIKSSVSEIITSYKKKRTSEPTAKTDDTSKPK